MSVIHDILLKLDGYLISIERNLEDGNGTYQLQLGIPYTWEYKSGKRVKCEVLFESETNGNLILLKATEDDVIIDEIVEFAIKILKVNEELAEMEKKMLIDIEEEKLRMNEKVQKYENEREEIKKKSFEALEHELE